MDYVLSDRISNVKPSVVGDIFKMAALLPFLQVTRQKKRSLWKQSADGQQKSWRRTLSEHCNTP